MVSPEIINGEIADLESRPPTYATIEKLVWLYAVRDHNTITSSHLPVVVSAETAEQTITYDSGTDFSKAINGRVVADVLPLIDEAMSLLASAYPACYNAIMNRLG